MRLVTSLLLVCAIACPAAFAERLDPKNTYAVIVGVLFWEQGALTTYSPEDRQDVALHKQLLRLGVPENQTVLLLDKSATREAIDEAVIRICSRAKEDSTLIVYYAGHGMKRQGEGIFACYDIQTRDMKQTGWRHSSLAECIKDNFKGDNVLLFADCCFSGALKNVAKQLSSDGFRAASLTSASENNTSTNNWTFTQSLVEAFSGKPIADANSDGIVVLSEAAYEVRQAMAFYEGQRNGFALHELPGDFGLVPAAQESIEWEEDFHGLRRGQYALITYQGQKRIARVIHGRQFEGRDVLQMQMQTYNDRPTVWVKASEVEAAEKPAPSDEPPDPLPDAQALAKASLDGKLTELLTKIEVARDFHQYGAFNNFGDWGGQNYAGHQNLPRGHWVYVYPHWYIWESIGEVNLELPEEPEPPFDAIAVLQPVTDIERHQNGFPSFDPRQMIGQPDTPQAGDFPTCWAAATADGQKAWIELDYENTLRPISVHVYENCAPGAVYQVSGVKDDKETLLWQGVDPTPQTQQKGISKIPLDSDQVFTRLRVYLDCKAAGGWNEIDAVALIDEEEQKHWAVDARASSVYAQQTGIKFVDPFQSKEGRMAEQVAEINAKIQQHKANIRALNERLQGEQAALDELVNELEQIKSQ